MSTKALDVNLTDGKLNRIDVLEPDDLSLYGATGKAPLGNGTNKLDASWLPDLDGSIAAVIGLPDPQYDSGWVTFTAGTELVLARGGLERLRQRACDLRPRRAAADRPRELHGDD